MFGFILRVIGVLVFAGLVILGIVFLPDRLMSEVKKGVATISDFASKEMAQRAPQIKQDVEKQAAETKKDAQNLYGTLKEKYQPMINDLISKYLTPQK